YFVLLLHAHVPATDAEAQQSRGETGGDLRGFGGAVGAPGAVFFGGQHVVLKIVLLLMCYHIKQARGLVHDRRLSADAAKGPGVLFPAAVFRIHGSYRRRGLCGMRCSTGKRGQAPIRTSAITAMEYRRWRRSAAR